MKNLKKTKKTNKERDGEIDVKGGDEEDKRWQICSSTYNLFLPITLFLSVGYTTPKGGWLLLTCTHFVKAIDRIDKGWLNGMKHRTRMPTRCPAKV